MKENQNATPRDSLNGALSDEALTASVTGLVFEDCDSASEETPAPPKVSFEASAEPEEKPVELSVPEKFEVNAKYDTAFQVEDAPRIITTYVPRFTEASENYRMADDPRPRFVKVASSTETATSEFEGDLDPTAEIDEEVSQEPRRVNAKKTPENDGESASKVFKFVENELPREEYVPAEEPCETVEEAAPAPEPEDEPSDANGEPKEYTIPDPVEEPAAVVDYTASRKLMASDSAEDAPSDIGDSLDGERNGRAEEFTSNVKRDNFKDRFLDTIMSLRVRFYAASAVAFVLLVCECMFAFGVDIPRYMRLASVPGAMALLDWELYTCLFVIALPETVSAFKFLFRGKASPELFVTAGYAVLSAYTVIIICISPAQYALFGFIFAVQALAMIGAAYFKKNAEFTEFKRISVNTEKITVDNKFTRTLERENSALDGIVGEHKSKTARFFRTLFVSDFFKRTGKYSENRFNTVLILSASCGISLVTALISFFVGSGIESAAPAFTLVFLLSCPAMSLLLRKLPYFYAERSADADSTAVIGEASLYDYAGIDVITFEDTEVFGAEDVALQRIMLYGKSDNLTKALRRMSALFMNVGGPLDRLFSDALDRKCPPATSVTVETDGISGEDNGSQIYAGTAEYMLRKGIRLPDGESAKKESAHSSTKVIYAAEDGAVYAKFYIGYSFSEEFSMLLPTLYDEGISPLVYTRDPNITNELMMTLTAGADKIRVLKRSDCSYADKPLYRKVSAGMVTQGDKMNAVNAIILAKRYAALQTRLAKTELLAMTVSAVMAAVLALGGMILTPSVFLGAWQAAWCGALHVVSARTLGTHRKNKR